MRSFRAGFNSPHARLIFGEKMKDPKEIEQLSKESMETFGEIPEMVLTMEECGELVQAISKYIRYKSGGQPFVTPNEDTILENIAEEIGDVHSMLVEVETRLGLKERVDKIQERKMQRLQKRIEDVRNAKLK